MVKRLLELVVAAVCLAAGAASAQQATVGIAVGTPGLGADLGYDFSDSLGLRVNANWFGLSRDVDSDGVNYDGKLKLMSLGLLADVYPFAGGFRFTGGAYYNDNHVNLTATPSGTVNIGGTTYTAAQVGTLSGAVDFNEFSPYAGIGYTSNRGAAGFSFVADAGVMFQGRPEVALVGTGTITQAPTFQADLARERDEIAHDIRALRFYPAVRLGVAYRF